MSATHFPTPAETVVAAMAREIWDGAVVATGVASYLPILAIAVARATHAPRLTYLSCVGALDPAIEELRGSAEDLAYLEGRSGEVSIPDLFDHARRGRVDVMFFGAAEVDGAGNTNLTAAGSLECPKVKFPGVAGAASLRRWVRHPVLLVTRQSRRNLVERVQVTSTSDPQRATRLVTDLAIFQVGGNGGTHSDSAARYGEPAARGRTNGGSATLLARHPWASAEAIAERTGFAHRRTAELPVTEPASPEQVRAMRRIDPEGLRERLVG